MGQRVVDVPLDLHAYLTAALQRSIPPLASQGSSIFLYDSARSLLLRAASIGDPDTFPAMVAVGSGVIGRAARDRQPSLEAGKSAHYALPLLAGETLVGVLVAAVKASFSAEDGAALLAAAAHITPLTHMARDHAALRDRQEAYLRAFDAMQELAMITSSAPEPEAMLTDAVRAAANVLDCEGAQVLLPDPIGYVLKVHAPSVFGIAADLPVTAWPLDGPGYLVEVYHTGQPFATHDPRPETGLTCYSLMACPLNTRSRTLGVLHLLNCRRDRFDETLFATAQAVANQIAVSLGSARIFAAERRRIEMLTQINRISQELYATLDPVSLLRTVAQRVHQTFGHEAVQVFMLSDDAQWLEVRASMTSIPQLELTGKASFPVRMGILGRAVRSGETQIVPDLRADPDYVQREETRRMQSALVVPLRRGETVIGLISVLSAVLDAFTDFERDALETLATQVSIALENARLYDQAQRRLLEQSIVHQIGQDLTAILDYHELSVAMVQHMNRALNTSRCRVGLFDSEQGAVRVTSEYHAPQPKPAGATCSVGVYLPLGSHHELAEAIRTHQPVTVYHDGADAPPSAQMPPEDHTHSQLVVPMVVGERVLGVVDWYDDNPGRVFADDDIQLARTLVAQATIAVENALLFKELETRAVELAEVHRLRSQFLATISHELRTPMNSIIGFSETLMEGLYGALNERQISRLQRIQRNGYSLLSLIDDLLDLSKIDAGRMKLQIESVSMWDVVVAAIQTHEDAAADKGLALTHDVPRDLPRVRADPDRLLQVITNLLSNAIKFTHDGSVTVEARVIERQGRRLVAVTVRDTGIGIDPSDQAYIFDEFRQVDGSSTRAYSGTGLGLAISRKLVEMMGGDIGVESARDRGSAFTFVLPAVVVEAVQP